MPSFLARDEKIVHIVVGSRVCEERAFRGPRLFYPFVLFFPSATTQVAIKGTDFFKGQTKRMGGENNIISA